MTFLHLLKIQCRLFSVSQIKEDILPLKTPWEKILFPRGKMTFLQNTGICWYANKITEVSFFLFYITKRGTLQKRNHRGSKGLLLKQKKNHFEIIYLYITSMGVYFMHLLFLFLFFLSTGKYFEKKLRSRG